MISMMKGLGAMVLAIVLIVIVPLILNATGRYDLYYTLTLISLLSIASAGVWITFYIGRINIGQAAYALIGGYVSAILVATYGWSFWWTIPVAGLVCAGVAVIIGLPILGSAACTLRWSPWCRQKWRGFRHWRCQLQTGRKAWLTCRCPDQ